jgi:hypothetical protein
MQQKPPSGSLHISDLTRNFYPSRHFPLPNRLD